MILEDRLYPAITGELIERLENIFLRIILIHAGCRSYEQVIFPGFIEIYDDIVLGGVRIRGDRIMLDDFLRTDIHHVYPVSVCPDP